jgi:hypothetical protein
MTTNNPENDRSTPDHPAATQDDAQLRELFSSLPVSSLEADLDQRVMVRVRRRKVTVRAAWAASLIVLLATGWQLSDRYLGNGHVTDGDVTKGDRDLPRPSHVVGVQPTVDSDPSPLELTDEVELFLIAYQGISSPVSKLETLESEPQALLSYLSSLAASMEIQ